MVVNVPLSATAAATKSQTAANTWSQKILSWLDWKDQEILKKRKYLTNGTKDKRARGTSIHYTL